MNPTDFTNATWRLEALVANSALQAERCSNEGWGSPPATAGGIYLGIFSVLAVAMFCGVLFCLHRWVPKHFTHAFKPWMTVLLLMPPLLLSLGVELAGYGVDCRMGCGSYAAYGATISYIAGSLSPRMYVSLFITLTVCPLAGLLQMDAIGTQRIDAEMKKVEFADTEFMKKASKYETWMKVGAVMMVLTGVCPTQAMTCDSWLSESGKCFSSGAYFVETTVHGLGVNVTLILWLIFLTKRIFLAMREHPEYDTWEKMRSDFDSRKVMFWLSLIALYSAEIHFVFWLVVSGAAGVLVTEHNVQRFEICMLHTSREGCVGMHMTAEQQNLFGDRYRCRWDEQVPFGIPPCVLDQCNKDGILDKNRLGISAEFLGTVFCLLGALSGLIWVKLVEEEAFDTKIESKLGKQEESDHGTGA